MRTHVASLRRLYVAGKITKEQVDGVLSRNHITEQEYEYIINGTLYG